MILIFNTLQRFKPFLTISNYLKQDLASSPPGMEFATFGPTSRFFYEKWLFGFSEKTGRSYNKSPFGKV
jgi:hypothetical protein